MTIEDNKTSMKRPDDDQVQSTMHAVRKNIGEAATAAKDAAVNAGADLAARATETAASVGEAASKRLDQAQDALSETGDKLAETLRRAAEDHDAGRIQTKVFDTLANGASVAAATLREKSVSQLVSDARMLARRNPGIFAAGAAVAGFALARFLKSSPRPESFDRYTPESEAFYRNSKLNQDRGANT
ncbi:MAG: hypothetical protein WAT77_07000 [Paracoccaceae bacterium]